MTRILGIDPGSRSTGYGLIEYARTGINYLASGCIQSVENDFNARLRTIYEGVDLVIAEYAPDECVVEQVFLAKNPMSALKLGQARGAAIVAALSHELPINEYAAREIKKVVVGTGTANKDQIQYMVKVLLKLDGTLNSDASDALAVAICHVFSTKKL